MRTMGERSLLRRVTLAVLLFAMVAFTTALASPIEEQADEGTPEILKQSETLLATEGETLRIRCNMKVYSLATLWYKGTVNDTLLYVEENAILEGAEKNYAVEREDNSITLIIRKVDARTTGLYTCFAQPTLLTNHTVQLKVSVDIAPQKNVEVGGNLMLSCKVSGDPKPTVRWYRKRSSGSSETELIGSVADITIPNVNVTDSGTYTCSALNEFHNASKSITIKVVNGLSAENDVVFVDLQKNEATVCCISPKGSANSLHWLKDGNNVVIPSSKFDTTFAKLKQCLLIKNVQEKDLGVYTCKIVKPSGTVDKASINLTGAPQVPKLENVDVQETKNRSSSIPVLKWKVGTFSPLLSYEIYVRKQGDTEWKFYDKQPVISDDKEEVIERKFDHLPNGQYATKLVVQNKHGSSELLTEDMPLSVDIDERPAVVDSGKGEADRNFAHAGLLVITILTTLLLCR